MYLVSKHVTLLKDYKLFQESRGGGGGGGGGGVLLVGPVQSAEGAV